MASKSIPSADKENRGVFPGWKIRVVLDLEEDEAGILAAGMI